MKLDKTLNQIKYITILNKIKYKPIIMETLFPLVLGRPCILDNLISKDEFLKNKLNLLFSSVKKKTNTLGKEYCHNLELYSKLREIKKNLEIWFKEINKKPLTYKFLKYELNFSYLKYLNGEIIKHYYNLFNSDLNPFKGIVFEYYSSLENVTISYLPNNTKYFDAKYLKYIEDANSASKEKNIIKQKIKLVLIIDENGFFISDNQIIKYPNINELELVFSEEYNSKDNLFLYFNSFLSKIEYLENIHKLTFHNKKYENYLSENNKINNEFYQSLLCFLFDQFYLNQNQDVKCQIELMKNVKEITMEMTFLYIYEKMKLYYSIYDIFSSLTSKQNDKNKNINTTINLPFTINNKIMIINNKENPIKINEIKSFIEYHLNNNKNNIDYLLIVNHNNLIKDESIEDIINSNIISDLKEFKYIGEKTDSNNSNDNIKELIDILTMANKNCSIKKRYEGYDKDNNLLIYREGETQIQSFDIIDLFQYNKKLTKLILINEKIIINYNEERTKLEIINNGQNKNEINKIINIQNFLSMKHFSQFIFNQKSLKELTITKFDVNLRDIENDKVQTLNLNYIKEKSILKYLVSNNATDDTNLTQKFNELFPHLINLNVGGNCQNLSNLLNKALSKTLKNINIITNKTENKFIFKVLKKIQAFKINNNINYLSEIINEDNEKEKKNNLKKNQIFNLNEKEEDYEEEEEEDNEEYEEKEEIDDLTDLKKINQLENEIDKKKNKY